MVRMMVLFSELGTTVLQPLHVIVPIQELEEYLVMVYTVWSPLVSQNFSDVSLLYQRKMQSVVVI